MLLLTFFIATGLAQQKQCLQDQMLSMRTCNFEACAVYSDAQDYAKLKSDYDALVLKSQVPWIMMNGGDMIGGGLVDSTSIFQDVVDAAKATGWKLSPNAKWEFEMKFLVGAEDQMIPIMDTAGLALAMAIARTQGGIMFLEMPKAKTDVPTFAPTSVSMSGTLKFERELLLAADFEYKSSNFHPQGLGYDPSSKELLFMQQGTNKLVRANLNGALMGTVNIDLHHTTSVAADKQWYYVSDFSGNSGGQDMYRYDKKGGSKTKYGVEKAAYGGFPIDVRDGFIWRTEVSKTYSWSELRQVRKAKVGSPDSIVTSYYLSGNTPQEKHSGIGDIAVDVEKNTLWVLEYKSGARLMAYRLDNGKLIKAHDVNLEGTDAGITYAEGKLYYWDWVSGNSKLRIYSA